MCASAGGIVELCESDYIKRYSCQEVTLMASALHGIFLLE